MDLLYRSTRDSGVQVAASQAILKGLSADGGLFVPNTIPELDVSLDELAQMSYQETAYAVMSRCLTDFTEEELKGCIEKATLREAEYFSSKPKTGRSEKIFVSRFTEYLDVIK